MRQPIPDDPDDGPIRSYESGTTAGRIREDAPEIVHYHSEYDFIYWNLNVIRALNQ